jgi:outer membrane protein OmpA-like peptidoglycan-associated protein
VDDNTWITGDFEGHYAGVPLDASYERRVYKPTIVRAIIRSPRRSAPLIAEGSIDADRDFDGRRRVPFQQDHIADAVVVSEDGTVVRVALDDVNVFEWNVPASEEDHGRTFGRIHGRVVARIVRPSVPTASAAPLAEPPLAVGWRRWARLPRATASGGWSSTSLAVLTLGAAAALCGGYGPAGGLACLGVGLGLYFVLGRGSWPLFRHRGCAGSLGVPALLFAALGLVCTGQRDISGCAPPAASDVSLDVGELPTNAGRLITAQDALTNPTAFFSEPDARIYLAEATLFEFNNADLSPAAVPELRRVARLLQEDRTRRVLVEGYADTIGDDAANLAISTKRADAVRRWLVDRAGVSPDQVTAVGRGSANPLVAPKGTRDEQRANRRVEVRPAPL